MPSVPVGAMDQAPANAWSSWVGVAAAGQAQPASPWVATPAAFHNQQPVGAGEVGIPPPPTRDVPVVHDEPPMFGDHYFAVWQCEESDWWVDYCPDYCHFLEKAWLDSKIVERAPKGHTQFRYDPLQLYQQNLRSNKRRPIRRILVSTVVWKMKGQQEAGLKAWNEANHQPRKGMPDSRPSPYGGAPSSSSAGGRRDRSQGPGGRRLPGRG